VHSLPHDDRSTTQPRLFERVLAPHLALTLVVPERRLLRTRRVGYEAVVVDLSVTGARLVLGAGAPVRFGALVGVCHAAGAGTVRVRHVHAAHGDLCCGVEFVELDAGLRAHLHTIVAGERVRHDWQWHTTLAR
jgi:hypothetical protein